MSNFQDKVDFLWQVAHEVLSDDVERGKVLLFNGAATRQDGKEEVKVVARRLRRRHGDKHIYKYCPPRPLEEAEADIKTLKAEKSLISSAR